MNPQESFESRQTRLQKLQVRSNSLKRVGLVALILCAALFVMGQTGTKSAPRATPTGTHVVWTAAPIPEAREYKNYDDYAAAVVNWALNEKDTATGKRVFLNSGQAGRYQIIINPNIRADTRLLDTQTGRTWTAVEYAYLEGKPMVWRIEDRVDNDQELMEWIKAYTPIKK